jgi:hypothetical protein
MAGKQAKVLVDHHVQALLVYVHRTRNSVRNRVIVLLSVKAGLRAGEIANLTWPMVTDPSRDIAMYIELLFKFSPATDPFRRPSGTSTATPTPNAAWSR